MNFNNYLTESSILYESIKYYNSLTEAAEEAFIPPTWTVEFTKFEPAKGEFSKALVKETVRLTNKVAFTRVIRDSFNDPVQGLIIMNDDVPLFAMIKNPKDTSKVTLMAIDPTPAKKLHRSSWTTYTAHDAKYYAAHGKYSEKTVTTTEAPKALEELLTIFVSNFVKGSNDDMDINDALSEIQISAKTIEVETDNEKASKKTDKDNDSGNRDPHDNKAIEIFSKEYLEKYIKDTVKLINDEVPNIAKAEKFAEEAIAGNFEKIKVDDIKKRLDKINKVIEKFGKEYNDNKNDNSVTSDPDWETKFAEEFAKDLKSAAAA